MPAWDAVLFASGYWGDGLRFKTVGSSITLLFIFTAALKLGVDKAYNLSCEAQRP